MKRNPLQRILRALWPAAACVALSATPLALAETHTWTGLGANGNFSNPQNWSGGNGPDARESAVILVFPAVAPSKNPVQDIASLGIDQIVIQGDGYVFAAAPGDNYFMRGTADVDIENGSNHATIFGSSASLVLNTNVTIHGSGGSFLIEGAVTGTGGLHVAGPTVELGGGTVNTYTGLTRVENGTLRLNKSIGVAFAGDLKIGITFGAADNERVVLMKASQIPDASDVTITPTGWLDLNGFNDTVHDIHMTSGRITTGLGSLTLLGQIQVDDGGEIATLDGRLNLGAATRTIDVATNAVLDVLGSIGGAAGAGLNKQGTGGLWLSESNSFSGPFHVYAGHVAFFDSWALGTAAGRTYIHAGAELVSFGVSVLSGEGLNLNGNGSGGSSGPGAFKVDGYSSPMWKGDIVLESDSSIAVKDKLSLTIDGPISGPGGWTKLGAGLLYLDGSTPNTYAGQTRVLGGTLALMKNDSITAIPAALVIGDADEDAPTNTVQWIGNHQVADNAPITINVSGFMNVDGNSEKIGPLTMNAGLIQSGFGLLTLDSLVTAYDGAIYGNLRLLGPTTFHLPVNAAGNDLYVEAAIQGGLNADLIKTGPGILDLGGTNTFLGKALVNEGVLTVRRSLGLGGSENGTIVNDGGLLLLAFGPQVSNEALVLRSHGVSTNSIWFRNAYPQATQASVMAWASTFYAPPMHDHRWAGPITLEEFSRIVVSETNDTFTISGPINGPAGLAKSGLGRLVIAGNSANTYQGPTHVNEGWMSLGKPAGVNAVPGTLVIGDGVGAVSSDVVLLLAGNQIADGAAIEVKASGGFDLNNFSETVGSLTGDGRVFCQLGTLTVGGNNQDTVWSGGILGHAVTTLIKNGTGTLRINSDNYYSGRTVVQAGALDVRGTIGSSNVRVQGGTLLGTGTVGALDDLMTGTVSPGASAAPGVLHSGSASFAAGATFKVELQNPTPGTGYDQLDVVGTVNLSGSTLSVTAAPGTRTGSTFMIVKNDGSDAVTGTFASLPQGATMTLNGQAFQIDYKGGDGNDVVLTHANTPPSLSSITATAYADEGGTVHINGTISDPDAGDTFSFVVNWGDGSPEQTVALPAGTQLFHVEHIYADEKPNAQPSDSFTINYTLKDSSDSPAFGQLNTIIGNVAPSLYANGTVVVEPGQALTSTLTFADPGADTWTATIDYGDGSGAQPLAVGPNRSLPFSHAFPSNGVYTVKVEVADDDGGKGTGTFDVVVGLQLSITKSNATQAAVSWPGGVDGYVLHRSTAVSGTNWTAVPGQPSLIANRWVQQVETTNSASFFRLVKP